MKGDRMEQSPGVFVWHITPPFKEFWVIAG